VTSFTGKFHVCLQWTLTKFIPAFGHPPTSLSFSTCWLMSFWVLRSRWNANSLRLARPSLSHCLAGAWRTWWQSCMFVNWLSEGPFLAQPVCAFNQEWPWVSSELIFVLCLYLLEATRGSYLPYSLYKPPAGRGSLGMCQEQTRIHR
jgi:hypothetical protein